MATIAVEKQFILDEIKRTAEANGGEALGSARFLQETAIKHADSHGKFWARWSDAVREAGFEPKQFNKAYDEAAILEKFTCLNRELGHFPVSGELRIKAHRDKTFPSHTVFARFGSKRQLAAKFLSHWNAREDYEDVLALCRSVAEQDRPAAVRTSKTTDGFVYLIKSGQYYKVGRSNSAGRRAYELSIQMPDRVTSVHTIRTDDPVGIEAYWHQRFESKRKNGEGFSLNSDDVRAFKRRNFI